MKKNRITALVAAFGMISTLASVVPSTSVCASNELPSSVDLSKSEYFPEDYIDQGRTSSCTACANTYYQFTYEARKALRKIDPKADIDFTYSPYSTYTQVTGGCNCGTTFSNNYSVLKHRGALKMKDFPYDTYYGIYCDNTGKLSNISYLINWRYEELSKKYQDLYEKVNEKYYRRKGEYISSDEFEKLSEKEKENFIPVNGEDLYYRIDKKYRAIPRDEQALFEALGVRVDNYEEKKLYDDLSEDEFITYIKEKLNEGKIVTTSTHYGYKNNILGITEKNGEKNVIIYQNVVTDKDGHHALTIVGYDDNFEYDINGNKKIDPGEKGAFKVYNSYGDDFGVKGWHWVMYDAVYAESRLEKKPDIAQGGLTRANAFDNAYTVNVSKKNIKLVSEVEILTNNFYDVSIGNACGKHELERIESVDTKSSVVYSGPFFTDITELCEDGRGNGRSYKIIVENRNKAGNTKIVTKSICIKDDKGNIVVPKKQYISDDGAAERLKVLAPGNYFEDYLSINLPRGDMNYDGAYDEKDYAVVEAYFADPEHSDLSQFQLELLDANDDGVRNEEDLAILSENMNG